jgi:hypothetical protein
LSKEFVMQVANQGASSARLWWTRFSVAGLAAVAAVVFAVLQIAGSGRVYNSGASRPGSPRGPAPDFWLTDYAAGRDASQHTGKPIFLVIRCEP